jgi:hypothetical protein
MMNLRDHHIRVLLQVWLMLLALCVCSHFAGAQSAVLMPIPEQPFMANGVPLANGFIYTYYSGSYTPAPNYTDYTGLVQNTFPVQLNASGFPTTAIGAQCGIWLQPATQYRIVVQNAAHVQIYQIDGVAGLVPSISSGTVSSVTATAPLTSSGGTAPNIAASTSGNGSNVQTTNITSGTGSGDVVEFDANGNTESTGVSLSNFCLLNNCTFTGANPTIPLNTQPVGILTGGVSGNCAVNSAGTWGPGNCSGGGLSPFYVDGTATTNASGDTSQHTLKSHSYSGTINSSNYVSRITQSGTAKCATTGGPSVIFYFQLNGVNTAVVGAPAPSNSGATSEGWGMTATCITTTTGSSGALTCDVTWSYGYGQTGNVNDGSFYRGTYILSGNLSGTVTFGAAIEWQTSSTSNSVTQNMLIME